MSFISILSPSKTQDFETQPIYSKSTNIRLTDKANLLIKSLEKKSPNEISTLMQVSGKIAKLNYDRYQNWDPSFSKGILKQALMAFKGDVYMGFDLGTYTPNDWEYAQQHLRILSGLYGLIRPLDKIQPYRLEMKTKLKTEEYKDLYTFWNTQITELLNKDIEEQKASHLVNLASNEYFTALQSKNINAEIITPIFKNKKGDDYKIVAIYAKRARGVMSNFIIKNQITKIEELKAFKEENYQFNPELSDEKNWTFTRA